MTACRSSGSTCASTAAASWTDHDWLLRHNIDRIERWEREGEGEGEEILDRLDPEAQEVAVPLVDGRFYYATVAAIEDAGVQPVWSIRVDSDDHSFISNGFVSHNTECRMAPLAMEMVRDIDKDTVDFAPNYDGRTREPLVLPARFPNLLVNGSSGIAVGMATNIPAHNLREVASGVQWLLEHPGAEDDELLGQLLLRIKGPDFPTRGLIMGTRGIEDAYRTGRGQVIMRAVVNVEEIQGRTCLVVTELPYQVNPDNLQRRSPSWSTPAGCRASRTCATTPRTRPACGSSSCSSGTPSRRSCSTTSTSTPSCRTPSARTCSPSSTASRAPSALTSSSATGSSTRSRSSSGAPATCSPRRSGRPTSTAATSRRSTRSTRSSP